MRLREVFDVDERTLLAAVAVDAKRFAAHAPLHERRHHAVVAHAGPVRDAVTQDRVGTPVERVVVAARHLGGDLRGDVEVTVGVGIEERVFVDQFVRRGGVHPHGRRQHDATGVRASSGLEHARGTQRVDLDGQRRIGDDVVHIGDGRQVEDDVRAGDGLGQSCSVEHVDGHPLGVRAMRRLRVEHSHDASRVEKSVDDVRADEPRPAGNGDSSGHSCPLLRYPSGGQGPPAVKR